MDVVMLRMIHAELFDNPDEVRRSGRIIALDDGVIDSGRFGPSWIFARRIAVDIDSPEMQAFITGDIDLSDKELVYVHPTRDAWLGDEYTSE